MKKYKLIKKYPGSPELGFITNGYSSHINNGVYNVNDNLIEPSKYPEFWEKVVEKDYEILSFVSIGLDSNGEPSTKLSDGSHAWLNDDSYPKKHSENSLLKNREYAIHSIKRLSDREVFTLGDTIDYIEDPCNKKIPIDSFQIHNGSIYVNSHFSSSIFYNRELNNWKHVKEPLFITEDGLDVSYGDWVFLVDSHTNDILSIRVLSKRNMSEDRKYFSTREAAEEHVIMNKPCLSINDVQEHLSNYSKDLKRQLKELAESKTKQL